MALIQAPKMVYDGSGKLVEVILSAEDFLSYLRRLAAQEDWESLPQALQDAVDRMLIDEVRREKPEAVDLDSLLAAGPAE